MIRTVEPAQRGLRGAPPVLPSPFSRALGSSPLDRPPASVIGLEQEYSLSRAGDRVDFRELIHHLPVGGRRLDPGDANAYRTPSGLVVTCDAEDAEVVSPPLDVRPGIAAGIATWADHGQAELFRLLPTGITVTPFSTHLSASIPDGVAMAGADLFARTFVPALMLLLDRAESHGVFVRPRPGRLELCGEHATGPRLGVAAVLVAGGTRACAAALAAGGGHPHLPPLLSVDTRPASGRPGLFVGRHLAFGYDFYAAGRRAAIPLSSGGTIGAQAYLEAAWGAARDALGADVGAVDLRPGDAMIAGSLPLGVEDGAAPPAVPPPRRPSMPASPFGGLLQPRRRPGYEVTAVAATWDFTVFRLAGPAREAFACVPGPQLGAFLERLDTGRLDELLSTSLDGDPTAGVLVAHEQTAVPGLWDRVVIGADLLPYERTDVTAVAPVPAFGVRPPPTYVRRGKAAVVLPTPTEPLRAVPISASGGQPVAPPPAPLSRPFEGPPPSPHAPRPGVRPARRRRPARIAVFAVILLLAAGSAAAVSGIFAGGKRAQVAVLTGPPTTFTGTAPATTGATQPPATEPTAITVAPQAPAPTDPPATSTVPAITTRPPQPSTVVTVPTPSPIPTPPPTNAPVETTVPVDTTVSTATTSTSSTTTVPPPTSFVVTITSAALGCTFQPASASAVAGSTVRFRNETGGALGVAVTSPGAAGTSITLETGSTSAGVSFPTPGAYGVTCDSGGGSVVGRMTITITAG